MRAIYTHAATAGLTTMKNVLLPIALFATSASLYAASLPAPVAAQLPAGYEPMEFHAGPRIEGGRHSLIVVAHRHDDSTEHPSPRPVMIFEEQPSGDYVLTARNDSVVMRADEGGQCDPFEDGYDGLAVKGSYFTVQNGVACGQHWTDFITFRYDARHRGWFFSNEIRTSFNPLDSSQDTSDMTRANPAKPVTFADWSGEH